jgi:hypothetical protein
MRIREGKTAGELGDEEESAAIRPHGEQSPDLCRHVKSTSFSSKSRLGVKHHWLAALTAANSWNGNLMVFSSALGIGKTYQSAIFWKFR